MHIVVLTLGIVAICIVMLLALLQKQAIVRLGIDLFHVEALLT